MELLSIDLAHVTWTKESYQLLVDNLYRMADEKYQDFSKKLSYSQDKIIGIRIPILKSLAKQISKTKVDQYFHVCQDNTFEEKLLHGLVIGYDPAPFETKIKRIQDFVPIINSWALCDSFVPSLTIVKKHRAEFLPLIEYFIHQGTEFGTRFAVVMLLDYYIQQDSMNYTLDMLTKVKNKEYYTQMAVAWTLCECYIDSKEKTLSYLTGFKWDKFVLSKAIQKMRESYRVSDQDKILLKELKEKLC